MSEDDLLAPDDEAPVADESPPEASEDEDERPHGLEGPEHLGLTPPD